MEIKKSEKPVDLIDLKLEIKLKAKNGIDFIFGAAVTWFGIFLIWEYTTNIAYEKSIFTFIFGSVLIPLALGFSKILKTNWKTKDIKQVFDQ